MDNWANKPEVKKGNIGEFVVEQYLQKRGFIVYKPTTQQNAHLCDRFCATPDKKHIFIADIKTKARRTHYPDTGFDIRHYLQYKAASLKYNLPIFIYFVDEYEKKIYGNKLSELEKPVTITDKGRQLSYPWKQNGIIYFLQDQKKKGCPMKTVCSLTKSQCEELKELSARNYDY